jgi:phospholipase B1, membrane-associated
LVPQIAKRNIPREAFKYINFQIGSNDLCWFCVQSNIDFGPGSTDHFEANIRKTLEALRAAIRTFPLHFIHPTNADVPFPHA